MFYRDINNITLSVTSFHVKGIFDKRLSSSFIQSQTKYKCVKSDKYEG